MVREDFLAAPLESFAQDPRRQTNGQADRQNAPDRGARDHIEHLAQGRPGARLEGLKNSGRVETAITAARQRENLAGRPPQRRGRVRVKMKFGGQNETVFSPLMRP